MYQLHSHDPDIILYTDHSGQTWCIPPDPANTDYQAYLRWLDEGNTPLPADTPELAD